MTSASFFAGIAMATFAAAGVFFLKFWRASKDPFFLYFCIACWLLSIERICIITLDSVFNIPTIGSEFGIWVYLIRLSAFVLIFTAVLQRNRRRQN